jgi:hypothetical protein
MIILTSFPGVNILELEIPFKIYWFAFRVSNHPAKSINVFPFYSKIPGVVVQDYFVLPIVGYLPVLSL